MIGENRRRRSARIPGMNISTRIRIALVAVAIGILAVIAGCTNGGGTGTSAPPTTGPAVGSAAPSTAPGSATPAHSGGTGYSY